MHPDNHADLRARSELHEGSSAPRYARIPAACRRYGWSRSGLYRLAGEGLIRLVKLNGTTLVDCVSADTFMAGLPAASIRVPHGQARMGVSDAHEQVPRRSRRGHTA
jgi:hypothetical protein